MQDKNADIDNNVQMEIGDYLTKPYQSPLFVTLNGKVVSMDIPTIFDSTNYDTIKCVTFVASPKFFYENIKDFEDVELIIGIKDGRVQKSFIDGFDSLLLKNGLDFFNNIPEEGRRKIISNNLKLLFALPPNVFHSKIYLLSNSHDANKRRVISGSVNFTNSAFNNKVKQFEECIIYDDTEIYNEYLCRYNYMKSLTVDYIPNEIKKRYTGNGPIYMKKEDLLDFLKTEYKDKNSSLRLFVEPIIANSLMDDVDIVEEKAESNLESVRQVREIIQTMTDTKTPTKLRVPSLLPQKKFEEIILKKNEKVKNAERYKLLFDKNTKQVLREMPAEIQESGETLVAPINNPSDEAVIAAFDNLDKFITSYYTHTHNKNIETAECVYEAILYTLFSPFIWKVRQEAALIGVGTEDIPLLCVISGDRFTGKTTLVDYLSLITCGTKEYRVSGDEFYGKISNIIGLMQEENIYPIIVNEFSDSKLNDSRSVQAIKVFTGDQNAVGPAFICCLNKNATFKGDLERRVYEIPVVDEFDKTCKDECLMSINEVYESATTALFDRVCYLLSEKISNGEPLFFSTNDILKAVRDTVHDLYISLGLTVPEYFSTKHKSLDDIARITWKRYYQGHSDNFSIVENEHIVLVDLSKTNAKDKKNLAYSVPGRIKKNESRENTVVMDVEGFFDWIGLPMPKKSFLKRLFSK